MLEEDTRNKQAYLEGYYAALTAVEEFTAAGHQISWILENLRKD